MLAAFDRNHFNRFPSTRRIHNHEGSMSFGMSKSYTTAYKRDGEHYNRVLSILIIYKYRVIIALGDTGSISRTHRNVLHLVLKFLNV